MNRSPSRLTIEQELNQRVFSDSVKKLSLEEAQDLLVQLHEQMMLKENLYRQMLLNQEKDIVDVLFGAEK